MIKLALCNEVIANVDAADSFERRSADFARQCQLAQRFGYEGLEVAPFTLAQNPLQLSEQQAQTYRRITQDHGLTICGLHWLLVQPAGLSLVSTDATVRRTTADALTRLVELAAALGATYLVHGSPQQRNAAAGVDPGTARVWALECLRGAAQRAGQLGITYCIEALARNETNFLNTVAQAVQFAGEMNLPSFKTMIDCSAAGLSEAQTLPELIAQWLPTGWIAHVQANDPNRKAPGQGALDFAPVIAALNDAQYHGWLAVEPFTYEPDRETCAREAARYLRQWLPAGT